MVRSSLVMLISMLLALTAAQRVHAQGWQPLFNGYSFDGWTTQNGTPVTADAWKVEDGGVMHLNTAVGRGGNILSGREYGNFELVFEWNISEKGNNGIKYRVNDFGGRVLGVEYQVIDDAGKNLKPKHKTASLYDIYEPVDHNLLKPPGEWNRGRIVVQGNLIEHWVNGNLVTKAEVGSQEWNDRIAKSKFHDVENFGTTPTGRIMITDHNDEVRYRNIFIRELSGVPDCSAIAQCVQPCCSHQQVCKPRRRLLGFFRRR